MNEKYIQVGGKLFNITDITGEGKVVNSDQVAHNGEQLTKELEKINNSFEKYTTKEELKNTSDNIHGDIIAINNKFNDYATKADLESVGIATYGSIEDANVELPNLPLGTVVSVNVGADDNYRAIYSLYIVVTSKTGEKVFKELSAGGAVDTGTLAFSVEEILVNDVVQDINASIFEANIGDKITFKFTFESQKYPDVRGTVYGKVGSRTELNKTVYPNGELQEWIFDTKSTSAGTYAFSLYGEESTGRQSERKKFTFQIGGLSISSTFDENKAIEAEKDLNIPVSITAADTEAVITAHVLLDDSEILSEIVTVNTSSIRIPNSKLSVGQHKLQVFLTNSKEKTSNKLNYTIVIAEPGVIYVIPTEDNFEFADGTEAVISLRIVELGQEKGKFNALLKVYDENNEIFQISGADENIYTLYHGIDRLRLIGLKYKGIGESTEYRLNITVENPETESKPVEINVPVKITKNDYNIEPKLDGLACWFHAAGKANNQASRDTWEDKSGNDVKTTFHNFNWSTNGWLPDSEGNTALTLNAGSYVEIDLTPFSNTDDKNNTIEPDGMTISVDFATRDILDSSAKVISCLYEYEGEDRVKYYLKDGRGNYILDKNSEILGEDGKYIPNIVLYFKCVGGYCWVDGKEYPGDGVTEYETIDILINTDISLDYNTGDVNPDYDGKEDLRKCLGYETVPATKQVGFYIDTQHAVLSNSSSMSKAREKFHLDFSENTRTRIDLLITRSTEAPYYFPSMIGYTNGMLSLMEAITTNDKFAQRSPKLEKFKIYLGAKATYNEYGNIEISDTGSSEIYDIKIFNKALEPGVILHNYASEIPDPEEKQKVIDNNGIINADSLAQLPQVCFYGMDVKGSNTINKFIMQLSNTDSSQVSALKEVKEPAYVSYTDPSNTANNWKADDGTEIIPIRLQFQGTSSMVYPVKNYKFRMHKRIDIDEDGKAIYGDKLKKDLGNGFNEHTFCLKADYMDSSHTNNTGSANFISDYNEITGSTPASALDPKIRTTIYGYPVLLYYAEKKDADNKDKRFLGVYNLNLDKSCTSSFGFDTEIKDKDGVKYNFSLAKFIDDEYTKDIMTKSSESCVITVRDEDLEIVKEIPGNYLIDVNGKKVGYVDELNNMYDLYGCPVSACECFEFKANSGASGAGGFGSYENNSVATDIEARYPDAGDLEDEIFSEYASESGNKDLTFKEYLNPYYLHIKRMIKWVMNSDRDDFLKNVDRHFNRNYLMDYFLTIMTLGGVDSLGKNLMMASWGPENYLFETTEDAMVKSSENYDAHAFKHSDGRILTPTTNKLSGKYVYAKDENGNHLYYDESIYNRYTKEFENGATSFADHITTKPGEFIWYPIFYDIDTICGLDNSGQLLFDVDIELNDVLYDGTAIFNTRDSHLWRRVNDYMGEFDESEKSLLADRWGMLTATKFTEENMIQKFYYERQIAKIPAAYYNQDCMFKYVYEGPFKPGEILPDGKTVAPVGSGVYLYCIHGSRYEQLKKWYKERIFYLNSKFRKVGATAAQVRFNHAYFDSKFDSLFKGDINFYSNLPALATKYPNDYKYNPADQTLYSADGAKIIPIEFKFKTYQPGYVGLLWKNGTPTVMARVSRDGTTSILGNTGTATDQEVFIYGGSNIKELGDLSLYNPKSALLSNLTKLNKLKLGASNTSTVIYELKLENNKYLTDIDLTNCSSLTSLDVTSCTNLMNLEMKGSGIASVGLPTDGGALKKISYSSAITSISIANMINLETITLDSLGNLTSIAITDCPKILGSRENPTAKAWNILQMTERSNLTSVEIESYGSVSPTSSGFFFVNKYADYPAVSGGIKGEIYYTGSVIPGNYTKFETAYPELKITYNNIKDASGMFANYKNLNCIQKKQVYKGIDKFGSPQYTNAYYWVDTRKDDFIDEFNRTQSSEYSTENQFYTENNGQNIFRMIGIYDDHDLDVLRAEIKKHISNFTEFTNINEMFSGLHILDYLDPDTFNNVDISKASTDKMFYGCKKLQYFETPNDVVKNTLVRTYYNDNGLEISEDEYNTLPEDSRSYTEKYVSPFTGEVCESETSIYKKGMRKLGSQMFYGCNRVHVFVQDLSNADKISIEENTFQYESYDPMAESQPTTINLYRPVILFSKKDTDVLLKTDEVFSTVFGETVKNPEVPGENNLFFSLNQFGDREIDPNNKYYVIPTSGRWLREVYFDIKKVSMHNSELLEGASISYAENTNGEKIIFSVEGSELREFNKGNSLNIISLSPGALPISEDELNSLEKIYIPLPKYDCLDTKLSRFDIEKTIYPLFVSAKLKNNAIFDPTQIEEKIPNTLKELHIINTSRIVNMAIARMTNFEAITIDNNVEYIGSYAFSKCTRMKTFEYSDLKNEYDIDTHAVLLEIGEYAFSECTSLKTANIPANVNMLGSAVYYGCSSLESVDYCENTYITRIPDNMFKECSKLQNIWDIPTTVTEIGNGAFDGCSLLEFIKPKGGPDSTMGTLLDKFPNLQKIGDYAFRGVNKISTTIVLGADGEQLRKVFRIRSKITYIGNYAFAQTTSVENGSPLELIWDGDYENGFTMLEIGSSAFTNIRFTWTPSVEFGHIERCLFVPRVRYIGEKAFNVRNSGLTYDFCLIKNKKHEVGDIWINYTRKIVYEYNELIRQNINNAYSTIILSNETRDGADGTAYIQYIDSDLAAYNVPAVINVNSRNFLVVQILSGAFSRMTALGSLYFSAGSRLELIETGVLTSTELGIIAKLLDDGTPVLDTIPETLTIETGNTIVGTLWHQNKLSMINDGEFITLGQYILGYKESNEQRISESGYELNLSGIELTNCNTIFDSAFSGKNISSIIFPNDRDYFNIYSEAFRACTKLNYINLPKNISIIGSKAFFGCPLEELHLPNTIKNIGDSAFKYSDNKVLGKLKKVIIDEGASFNGNPFDLQTEISTGVSDPREGNITLKEFAVPSTMSNLLNRSFQSFSLMTQTTKLYLGNLEINDDPSDEFYNTIYCKNYPMYLDSKGLPTYEDTGVYYTDSSGRRLYCPKFFRDITKVIPSYANDTSLTTTETHSVCPLGDVGYISDTEYERPGFAGDIDLTRITVYPEVSPLEPSIDISGVKQEEFTREDILRILAGYTTTGSPSKLILGPRAAQLNPTDLVIFNLYRGAKVNIQRTVS